MSTHLKDVNETYFEHMLCAAKYGIKLIFAGIACIITHWCDISSPPQVTPWNRSKMKSITANKKAISTYRSSNLSMVEIKQLIAIAQQSWPVGIVCL